MSFSNGVFSISTAGNPVVTGTTVSSTWANALTADLATGLSTCMLKDGTQTTTANIPMSGFKFTNTPGVPVLGTVWASTSGTENTWTGIPSWATKITVTFANVSLSGTNQMGIRLGDAGGIETSGYVGSCNDFTPASTGAITLYWLVTMSTAATAAFNGAAILTLQDASTFTWAYVSNMSNQTSALVHCGAGSKALSAVLTQIQVLSSTADTFDAGTINIVYE